MTSLSNRPASAAAGAFRTAPLDTDRMPPGIPFIIGNEAAERFSFYGMKTILAVFMTQYMLSATGTPDYMTRTEATEWVAWFVASAYFFPVLGALIADALLGKYLTIMILSMVYCLGHAALACIDLPSAALQASLDPRSWLMAGLFLIACGSGGIKPCVSAHVGDQFCRRNGHLMSRVFGWFYFSINFGSFFSTLLTPWLLKTHGPGWAFGVPGVLMAIATFVFWLGRKRYAHLPPQGFAFLREATAPEGRSAILRLVMVYAFVAVFWSLYDQTGSAWVLQAGQMDCNFLGIQWLESQVQAVNPLLILIYVPLFAYVIYPAMGKLIKLTPLRKIGMGFALTVAAFAISAHAQRLIDDEQGAFRAKIAPMVAAEGIDLAKTAEALRALERNAPAAELDALRTTAASTERDGKVADTIALGGIAIAADGTKLEAQWPSIAWQLLAYLVLTAAEVMVSITGLEFSYTQAPASMKSIVMSLWLLSVSAGNVLTALVNRFTQDADGNSTLVGASYYWFFTALMLGATLVFMVASRFYRYRDVLPAASHPEAANG